MSEPVLILRVAVLPLETLDVFGAGRAGNEVDELLAQREALDENATVLTDELYRIAGTRGEGEMPAESWDARNAVLALRRDVHNRRSVNDQTLERAQSMIPTSVQSDLKRFHASLAKWNENQSRWDAVYTSDLDQERKALLDRTHRPEFEESVWLASRSLLEALQKLPRREVTAWRNEETHAALKILAYLVRSATKTSPNSLFAATALATFGTRLKTAGSASLEQVRTRLNVYEARKVTACLAGEPALRPLLRPRLNPTLHATPEGWSWWRPASLRRDEDEDVRMEAAGNPILDHVVQAARAGEQGWADLTELVVHHAEASHTVAERFLSTLVERGILVAEVEIPFLEARPLAALAKRVRDHEDIRTDWLPQAETIERTLDAPPPLGSPDRRSVLTRAGELLESLPHVRPLSQDELFRVDAVSSFQVEVPAAFREELWRAVDAYVRMFAGLYPFTRRELYARFFLEQFPADTDVPALEIYQRFLEPEFDIELGALPEPSGQGSQLEQLKRRLIAENGREVRLRPEEFLEVVPSTDPGRWMAGALFQVALPPGGDPADPRLRIVLNALFHGCGLALARFHDLYPGDAIAQTLRRGWSSLVPQGAVPAEINYLPWGRTANASLRPRLFEHEIELPGERTSSGAIALPLTDLFVRFGSVDRRFHITSQSVGREVVPFLSSGVRPQGFTSFLVHAGMQDLFPVAFFPGLDDPDVVHWPRLTLDRVVLFRERWVFGRDRQPADISKAGPRWFERVAAWRRVHHVPRRVFAGSSRHGKPFYVDLESPLLTERFRRFLLSLDDADRCVLSEMLPGPDELWLRDERGSYASEFLTQLEGPLVVEGGSR